MYVCITFNITKTPVGVKSFNILGRPFYRYSY